MKTLIAIFLISILGQGAVASVDFQTCVTKAAPAGQVMKFASGKAVTGSLICSAGASAQTKVVPTSSDRCCYHRGADGTCYHENPACSGCQCFHRGADGTCYHCSCGDGC